MSNRSWIEAARDSVQVTLTCLSCSTAFDDPGGNVVMCPRCGMQVRPSRSPDARSFVVDSNGYDPLVDTPGVAELVINACERGEIELLMTHVQYDELMADEARRDRTLALPIVVATTYGFVLGVSKLGMARLGGDEVNSFRSSSGGHTRDALIATTAQHESAILVTNDRRLTNAAREQGVEVWTSDEFTAFLREI